MKTMNDFKGTQGEFEPSKIYGPRIVVSHFESLGRIVTTQVCEAISNLEISENESEANARLFANSKKVLEAAIAAADFLKDLNNHSTRVETSNWWSELAEVRFKLEQVINDSL